MRLVDHSALRGSIHMKHFDGVLRLFVVIAWSPAHSKHLYGVNDETLIRTVISVVAVWCFDGFCFGMWDCVHPMWRYVAIGIDTRDDIFHFMNGPDWISAKVFLIICIVSIIGA